MRNSVVKFTGLYSLLYVACVSPAAAETIDTAPHFAGIFSDHAVLQRGETVHVWGTSTPSQRLILDFQEQHIATTSDANGRWDAHLQPIKSPSPSTLRISDVDGQVSELKDVVAGDVYLCGGQSNMEFPARFATGAMTDIGASGNANMRFVNIPKDSQTLPQADLRTSPQWQVAGPQTIGDASAVCYYMAKTMQSHLNVPIGFIDAYWGGTTIQGWISAQRLQSLNDYAQGVEAVAKFAASPTEAMSYAARDQEGWWAKNDASWNTLQHAISPKFNDASWSSTAIGKSWRADGPTELRSFEGTVWYRTSFNLTEEEAQLANSLNLGLIDSYDTAWVNGTWVGSMSVSWVKRAYSIPSGVFRAGKNVVAVHVLSGAKAGGFTGGAGSLSVGLENNKTIPLPTTWKYKIGTPMRTYLVPSSPWQTPTSLTTLYNGMINPIKGYNIKLVAWYQGEANGRKGKEYETLLPLLINDWRVNFGKPKLPFLIAQLPGYGTPATKAGKSDWAELREAQRLTVERDPHAALVVTIDIGDRYDVHPSQKAIVGARFARAARSVVYGEDLSAGGPQPAVIRRVGADIVITFSNTLGRLLTYSGDQALAFEVCSAPDICSYQLATVSGDRIILPGANRSDVTTVRYAWADAPFTNLFAADDLPVVPFSLAVPAQ